MLTRALAEHALLRVRASAEGRSLPVIMALASGAATSTLTVPVEWLVVAATLAVRHRWMAIAVSAATGSAIASLALYLVFHHIGWPILLALYPDIVGTRLWSDVTRWLQNYGIPGLFAVMAFPVPIPKLPALAFAGIYRMPVPDVFAAILTGKLLKYFVYAATTAHFPGVFWFVRSSAFSNGARGKTRDG